MSVEKYSISSENVNKNLDGNQQTNQNENLEISKNSTGIENTNTTSQQGIESEESLILFYEDESEQNEKLTKDEQKTFEKNFNKYYLDSSKNTNGNFDTYIENGLKLISCLPNKKIYSSQIEKIKEKFNLPELNQNETNKKTLILDLDETLIHSDLDFVYDSHDVTLSFEDLDEDGQKEVIPIPLILRPYLKEFLDFVSQYFELIVFTASYKSYAEPILDYLEKDKKYFKLRLFREHCIKIHNCLYIKDLSIFEGKRKLENLVIVDNSIFSFAKQLNSGILVTSFYNDINDSFLSNLCFYLKEYILPSNDVRKVNEQSFGFVELSKKLSIV